MKKVMIVLGTVMILIGSTMVGCGKSEGEKKKDLVGTYINKDDSSEYFILEEDGTYRYYYEKLGIESTAKWKVEGNKLITVRPEPIGRMPPSEIKGNKIFSTSGSIFVKAERRNPVNLGLTNIVGEYVHKFNRNDGEILIINNDGTFESKGKSTLKGDWEINGNKIVFYFYVGQQRIKAASLSGELRGGTLYSAGGSMWTKQGEAEKITKKEVSPKGKISKDSSRISGRYTMEVVKINGIIEKPPGVTIFKEDGTMVLRSSGAEFVLPKVKWRFKDGVVQLCPDDGSEPTKGKIEGNTITFETENGELIRYVKQN